MLGWSGSNSPCRAAWTGRLSNPCLRIDWIEDVDYRAARGLDRALFQALAAGRWIEEAQNLIIEGPAGVGKSWLACALGHKACRDNRSVLYQRAPRMFADLALARGDGRYPRLMRALGG